jgi:integrase
MRERAPGVWELRVPLPRDPVTGTRGQLSVRFRGAKREAEKELARIIAAADDGRATATQATLAFLLDRWWEQKRGRLSISTAAEYRRIIDRQIVPELGKVKLSKLTVADLDSLYLRLERSGLAPSSVRQVHAVISGALKQAVKWRWIGYNPARDASLPAARRHRIQPPDPTKVRAVMAAAEAHSPELGLFIRLAALLGARRGELCGLQWGDIDEAAGTVKIRRGVVEIASTLHVKDTKTHAERVVSLDPATAALLRRHRSYVEERARDCGAAIVPDAFILSPAPDGSTPLRPNLATDVFRRIRHDVGLDTARLHDLRHFVATQLIGAGHDIRTVSGRLGHAQTSTTLNTYAAFLGTRDREAANQLAALLDPEDSGGAIPDGSDTSA